MLDTLGVFTSDPPGNALIAKVLFGHGAQDPAPRPCLRYSARSTPPRAHLRFRPPPGWSETDPDLHAAFAEPARSLEDKEFEAELPTAFEQAAAQRQIVNFAEMSRHHSRSWTTGKDRLGSTRCASLGLYRARSFGSEAIFERRDAILCLAARGPAPGGLGSTGNSIFDGLWTFSGTPAVTVPLLTASTGLPMGVQLVAGCSVDARPLRTAQRSHDRAGRSPPGTRARQGGPATFARRTPKREPAPHADLVKRSRLV